MADGDLFRRDQTDGISPPNLADESTYAEHVVRARGKTSRFTSLSLDPSVIRDFGNELWRADQAKIRAAEHLIVSHADLAIALRAAVRGSNDDDRERAARALPRVLARKEALVHWKFDCAHVERKDLITWATARVRDYFSRA